MMQFFIDGGLGSWFVLAFGVWSIVTAIRFARAPERPLLRHLKGLTLATLFSTLAGISAGFASTLRFVSDPEKVGAEFGSYLALGLAESLTLAILGFGLLAITWLVAALGLRRLES